MGNGGHAVLFQFLLFSSGLCFGENIKLSIYLPSEELNWDDAREYCQKNYTDLVTLDLVDISNLSEWLKENNLSKFWIGIIYTDSNDDQEWEWINLKTGEGVTGIAISTDTLLQGEVVSGDCGLYSTQSKRWSSEDCGYKHNFMCFDDNLVVVTENKTWEDALRHCREMTTASYQYDLLSLTNVNDYSYIRDKIYRATTDEVWTGLRFLGGEWWWSDGQSLDEETKLPDCPIQNRHCGTMSKDSTINQSSSDCSEKRNFICYREESDH